MKTILAIYGGFILVLHLAGIFGLGNFRMYFGPDERGCSRLEQSKASTGEAQ